MTDIVERLRVFSQTAQNGIMREAADEIERLRAALESLITDFPILAGLAGQWLKIARNALKST